MKCILIHTSICHRFNPLKLFCSFSTLILVFSQKKNIIKNYLFRFRNHHVRFKKGVLDLGSETFDQRMSERQVRHKISIHYVEMEIVSPVVQESLGLFAKLRQIGIQDRRTNFCSNFSGHCGFLQQKFKKDSQKNRMTLFSRGKIANCTIV